jgi:hypothetical protein
MDPGMPTAKIAVQRDVFATRERGADRILDSWVDPCPVDRLAALGALLARPGDTGVMTRTDPWARKYPHKRQPMVQRIKAAMRVER